jgi:hypothetical protein
MTLDKEEYYIEPRLKKVIDEKIKPSLEQKDKDCFLVIDGKEGSGKSFLALQIGKYFDKSLTLDRVCFSAEEFKNAIFKAKKGQCIIFDEAFTGLSSRSSLSSVNRALISLAMQMRQKNLFVIIVLPTFFLLDKYIALFRTKALIHVYESKGKRGYFRIYNYSKKKNLYMLGQKTYSYVKSKVHTNFRGRFYGKFALGEQKEEEKYREKKAKALEESESNPLTNQQVKYMEQRNLLIHILKKELKLSYRKMEKLLDDFNFGMTYAQIRLICQKFGDIDEEEIEKKKELKALEEEIDKLEDKKDEIKALEEESEPEQEDFFEDEDNLEEN